MAIVLVDGWRATRSDGSTICEGIRCAYHTDTTRGRRGFTATWTTLSFIFWRHILK